MSHVKITKVDDDVPYWAYKYARIVLTENNELYTYGTDNYSMFYQNEIAKWNIPYNVLGNVLNDVLEQIAPLCDKLVELSDKYDSTTSRDELIDISVEIDSLNYEIETIIEDAISSDTSFSCAVVFDADDSIMTEWFINGETPEEIEDYVSDKLIHEDYWVYFPYSPSDYREVAERYYRDN